MARQKTVSQFKDYTGDVNLEYGGLFLSLTGWEYGYATFLEVIDLDSACGIDNCCLVQAGTIMVDDQEIVTQALHCCGWTDADLPKDEHGRKLMIAEACHSYGHYDNDEYFQNLLIWQPFDDDEPQPDADSWRAELIRLPDDQDVFSYLYSNRYLAEYK